MEGGVKYVDAGRARKFGNKSPFAIIRLEIQVRIGNSLAFRFILWIVVSYLAKNYSLKPPFCSNVEREPLANLSNSLLTGKIRACTRQPAKKVKSRCSSVGPALRGT